MLCIVEPKDFILKLLGSNSTADASYRQMNYILAQDTPDGLLLQNAVTGELVRLSKEEASAFLALPGSFCDSLQELIDHWFVVPSDFDEKQYVQDIRALAAAMSVSSEIHTFNILLTTACNARCFYCFENNWEHRTMTDETVEQLIRFIEDHCGDCKELTLAWFGGEPTLAASRIDAICRRLTDKGFHYHSIITTNGYLLGGAVANHAKELWNLVKAQVTLDGTEEVYNRIKAYPGAVGSPYRQVIHNIHELLDLDIPVAIRLNVNLDTLDNMYELVEELKTEFDGNPKLRIYAHQILEFDGSEYEMESTETSRRIQQGAWKLEARLEELGFYQPNRKLPILAYQQCMADSDETVTITPEGHLAKCEHYADETVGDLWNGITDDDRIAEWKENVEYDNCHDCPVLPACFSLRKCVFSRKQHCEVRDWAIEKYRKAMRIAYQEKTNMEES